MKLGLTIASAVALAAGVAQALPVGDTGLTTSVTTVHLSRSSITREEGSAPPHRRSPGGDWLEEFRKTSDAYVARGWPIGSSEWMSAIINYYRARGVTLTRPDVIQAGEMLEGKTRKSPSPAIPSIEG